MVLLGPKPNSDNTVGLFRPSKVNYNKCHSSFLIQKLIQNTIYQHHLISIWDKLNNHLDEKRILVHPVIIEYVMTSFMWYPVVNCCGRWRKLQQNRTCILYFVPLLCCSLCGTVETCMVLLLLTCPALVIRGKAPLISHHI